MTRGARRRWDVVDYRFALVIEEILQRKWIVSVQLNASQVAEMLGVSRATLYQWKNRKCNISKKTAWQFKDAGGMQGYFARCVLNIHTDNQRKLVKEL